MTTLPLSQYDPNELRQRLVDLGTAWAEANGAAELLEEGRKSVLAQYALKMPGKSMAERESMALACDEYREYFRAMVSARTKANRAMVEYRAAQTWIEMVRTLESSRRAEMGMR